MPTIKKLPQYLINQLKAGEIVERPASIVKELIENSLDAGADHLEIFIEQGGKKLIQVSDNGQGLDKDDLILAVERYATSKIISAHDLESIGSYGFRGEALASISEVSVFSMQSKKFFPVGSGGGGKEQITGLGYELYKSGDSFDIKEMVFAGEHGTRVFIESLFHMIPAREKFLKSDATEWRYIKSVVEKYAIVQRDKSWVLNNNGKQIWNFPSASSLLERVLQMTKKSWENKLKVLEFKDEQLHLYGLVGDASLHFQRATYFHIFVNGRPVEDRLLKKAIMDAYQRQIVPGTYPFVVLFVEIDPKLVDVNVHPRKIQVKFLDPGSMFTLVKESIRELIGGQKVNYAAFTKSAIQQTSSLSPLTEGEGRVLFSGKEHSGSQYGQGFQQSLDLGSAGLLGQMVLGEQTKELFLDGDAVKILGQLWESYIVLEGKNAVYYVDQHAIAERINFEKMRTQVKQKGFQTEILLNPLTIEYPANIEEDTLVLLLENLHKIGFDVSEFGNHKVIVHAVPKVFAIYKVNVGLVFNFVRSADFFQNNVDEVGIFDTILDEILGMKACKASIKAGQRLSMLEMEQLIGDAIQYIPGMFVCQHGRPSVVAVRKSDIERLFERH